MTAAEKKATAKPGQRFFTGKENLYVRATSSGKLSWFHRKREVGVGGERKDYYIALDGALNQTEAYVLQQKTYPAGVYIQVDTSVTKFSEQTWEKFLTKLGKASSTARRYRSIWPHLAPTLDGKRVEKLSPAAVIAITQRLEEDGSPTTGEKFSVGSLATMQTALSAFYRVMAPRAANPVLGMPEEWRRRSGAAEPIERDDLLSAEEVEKIAAYLEARGQVLYATIVRIAPHLGLRISELLALRWDELTDGLWLQVKWQIADKYVAGESRTWFTELKGSPTKGVGKQRAVAVSPYVKEILHGYKVWNLAQGLRCDLVFPNSNHRPLNRGLLNAAIKEAAVATIGKDPTFHIFRHTYASRLFAGGLSYGQVAKYLGDTEDTVRKTYVHFFNDDAEAEGVIALLQAVGA